MFDITEEKIMTNERYIKNMDTEELAEFLFDLGNGCEYCCGVCAFHDECDGQDHAQEFCMEQINRWLKNTVDETFDTVGVIFPETTTYPFTFTTKGGLTKEEALKAWQSMYKEIDKENWLFVGTINPQMVEYAVDALIKDLKDMYGEDE